MRKILIYFYKKYNGDDSKIFIAIKLKEQVSIGDLLKITDEDEKEYCTIIDDDYPENLKLQVNPPIVFKRENYKEMCKNVN